ncbi:sterol-binding-like protein [Violaceomyces palustris]|uniref:Sterol-binding-like protein n=1 Tax=Violaceomyces palustris TaxID=1673888 RepID=A0ACD0P654_9BASI|nr:sterol-binding-like protein [Violaceomyces palustris]
MAPSPKDEDDSGVNMFNVILEQAEDLDFTNPDIPKDQQKNPSNLIIPGLEMSKIFAVVEFALMHSLDEDGILSGLNMMNREQAVKAINGTFQFNVRPAKDSGLTEKEVQYFVDMRKKGEIVAGPGPSKPKPDVILTINDRDMVNLAMGKMNPQMAFMKGKIKVKGNLMLGLRMQTVLQNEVAKMTRVAKL